VSGGERRKS